MTLLETLPLPPAIFGDTVANPPRVYGCHRLNNYILRNIISIGSSIVTQIKYLNYMCQKLNICKSKCRIYVIRAEAGWCWSTRRGRTRASSSTSGRWHPPEQKMKSKSSSCNDWLEGMFVQGLKCKWLFGFTSAPSCCKS